MGLLDRLRRLASWADPEPEVSRALVPPVYHFGQQRVGITQSQQQPGAQSLLTDGFSGIQATASRAIADRVADLEFVVRRLTSGEDGTKRYEEDENHALQSLLDRPNPLLSRRQLLKLTSYWLTQTGEAFYLTVTNGAGRPVELWPMSPANTEKLSSDSMPVAGYVFHGEQGETRYRLDEVVWIFDPDPADPFSGVGVIGPQAREYDAANFASSTLRTHFQKDATPKVVLKADAEAQSPNGEQRDLFWADWQNRYNKRDGENVGVPAFLPSGFSLQELSGLSNIDDVRAYLEYERDNLLMANGVPRSILGDVVDANRAAAETNQFVFDRHTIQPQAGLIADALTNQLAIPTFGDQIQVGFRDFVSADEDLRLREEQQDLTTKVRSVNQVREDRGLDPVEWGDDPIGTFGDQPYDPNAEDEAPTEDTGGSLPPGPDGKAPEGDESVEEDEEESERAFVARAVAPRIKARFTPAHAWSRLLQHEARFVPRMVSATRKVFAGQKGLVLDALPALVAEQRSYGRADGFDALFDSDEFRRLFEVLVDPVRTDAAHVAAENTLHDLEVSTPLIFVEAAEKAMSEIGAEMIQQVNETTKRAVRATLTEGIREGESFRELEGRVRRAFNQASKNRARTIARTEVGRASQMGRQQGFEASDVVKAKEWVTAFDERVRDSHVATHGQIVGVTENFTLGDGEKAYGPRVGADGAVSLSARNSINCRCDTLPVLEET